MFGLLAANKAPLTPLKSAASSGDLAGVQEALAQGAAVDEPGDEEYGALHLAAKFNHLDVVRALLAAGASTAATDRWGWTALHVAELEGHVPVMEALLEAGADPDARAGDGTTVLHWTAQHGRLDAMALMLRAGARVDLQDTMAFFYPLMSAAYEGHADAARMLLEAGADVHQADDMGSNSLVIAARKGFADVVDVLVAAGATEGVKRALGSAVGDLNPAVLRALLAVATVPDLVDELAHAPVYAPDHSLHPEHAQVQVVDLLLAAGADWRLLPDDVSPRVLRFAKQRAFELFRARDRLVWALVGLKRLGLSRAVVQAVGEWV